MPFWHIFYYNDIVLQNFSTTNYFKPYFIQGGTMYSVTTEGSFDAAHFLKDYQGKCKNIHLSAYMLHTISRNALYILKNMCYQLLPGAGKAL